MHGELISSIISDNLWDVTFKTCGKLHSGTKAYITVWVYDFSGDSTSFGVDGDPLAFDKGQTQRVYGKHFGSILSVEKIMLFQSGGRGNGWAPEYVRFYSRATVCPNRSFKFYGTSINSTILSLEILGTYV